VRDYDPRWRDEYSREATALRDLLGQDAVQIEHVGSTAVPGLAAKPLIDIAVIFSDRTHLETARERLAATGYDDRGDVANDGGVIVAKGPPSGRTHTLHLVEVSDPQWRRWLTFRDRLRGDDDRRNEYAALKKELAARYPLDRPSYVAGKRDFIRETVDPD
jgi:GrpB-like predicted nucleotidyltransferase (UPF0157 family)